MSVNIDIRGQLRHPVFDPDYKRPQAKIRPLSTNQKAETPSRDNHVTSGSSSSSSMSETDSSDDDNWRGRRQTMKTSPTSATVTITDIKAVTFGDNLRKERGRTAAGKDTSSGGRTAGRSGDGGDTNRIGLSKKTTKIRKWRSLSDADSQPIGINTRQHQRERETADLQPKKCTIAAKNGRMSESKQTYQHLARPSNFTRFKYPVKFHRSVGETPNTALRGLITSTFDVPDCMRRPSSISWLPVRQGSVVDRGRSNSRTEANRTDSYKSTTAIKSTHRSTTKMETQGSDKPPPSSEELELNGVYHVIHAEHSRSGPGGGRKTGKIDPESRRDSDPDTAISSQHVASLSLESNSSTSSESEQDDDGHNLERDRPSSDADDDRNVIIKNNRSKKTMTPSSRDDNASSDNEAYSDDFVE